MASAHEGHRLDFEASVFPLAPDWSAPQFAWHDAYPDCVPPGLNFSPMRTEQLLLCARDRYPHRFALRYFGTNWCYADLVHHVRQAAGNFRKFGVQAGDRVLVVLPNCPEFVVAWFALHWLGAEVIPGSPLASSTDLSRLVRLCRATTAIGLDLRLEPVLDMARRCAIPRLFVSSLSGHLPVALRWPYRMKCWMQSNPSLLPHSEVYDFNELLQPTAEPVAEPVETNASLTAVLQPTGGTTGTPKVAQLTHANLHANVAQLHVWSGLEPGTDVVLAVLPFFHVFGATVCLMSTIAGGSTLLLQANFNPSRVWKLMNRWRPTVAPMVPFMFSALCEQMQRRGRNIQGLRFCFSGASALPREVREEFQARTGATVVEGYGLSEASPVTHSNPPHGDERPGTIGLPLPGTQARIVDAETGRVTLPPGQIGELIVRGPQVMAGYLNQPEETAHMLRDGWLYTGDLARMDEEGFFTLVDRKKDMIISGGLNVYPAEVEVVLAGHPSVSECAVVGAPDGRYGETIVAYVVPTPGSTVVPDEIQAFCRTRLASYKIPRTIHTCGRLPTNFLGKVRRVELRARAA